MSNQELKLLSFSELAPVQTEWLFPPYIPANRVSIIFGDPGVGKSTFGLYLAAMASLGNFYLSEEEQTTGNTAADAPTVLILTAEDHYCDTVLPRLIANNAALDRIKTIDTATNLTSLTDECLEHAIKQSGCKLLIIDPLQSYLGAGVDMHRANEVRPVMAHLSGLAEKYACTIILISHLNKSNTSKAIYRCLGSIDVIAASRSALLIGELPSDPDMRVMVQIKSSLAKKGSSLAFLISDNGKVTLIPYHNVTANELLYDETVAFNKTVFAKQFLSSILRAGPLFQQEIAALAAAEGIKDKTLRKAKKELDIASIRDNNHWKWELPDSMHSNNNESN